jgi:hypothetical protein
VIKFGKSHKTSTPQDQLKMIEYEVSHMEFLTQFYMKKNNYDVPSSIRHLKNAPSVSLNPDLSPNMVKEAKKVFAYEQKAHQVQKKPQHEQKKLWYKKKTSSDSDTRQDEDLAKFEKFEGFHPREGITRHHTLLVPPRAAQDAVRPTQPLINLIAAGKVIVGIHNPVIYVFVCFRIPH